MKMSFFLAWLDKFFSFEKTPQKKALDLSRMRRLCECLSHPENLKGIIHIAGTKGKGSSASLISSFITGEGYRCGVYTSPHVYDFRERVREGNNFFPEEIYEMAAKEIVSSLSSWKDTDEKPTWFELVTAFAFVCFRLSRVDFAILEVGLGGRLDATNVVRESLAVLLNIEKEHTRFLGNTIEEIAKEKCAIVKEDSRLIISSDVNEKALGVYLDRAREMHSFVRETAKECRIMEEEYLKDGEKIKMRVRFTEGGTEKEVISDALGHHQAKNILHSYLAAKEILKSEAFSGKKSFNLECCMKARFEILKKYDIPVVIDGAHTPLSVETTLRTIKEVFPSRAIHVLFGIATDKNIKEIARKIELSNVSRITLTSYFSPRASKACEIKKFFSSLSVFSEENLVTAFASSLEEARKEGAVLLVLGSFYLAADVKKIMER